MHRQTRLWRAFARWASVPIVIGAGLTASAVHPLTGQAAPGVAQTVQAAAYLGTTSMSGASPGTFVDSIDDIHAGADSATVSARPSTNAGTPNPAGRPVTTSGSVTGFDGLDHRDQRLAGTGIYTNTQFSLEPPDQGLCVGNGFVVESVNTAFQVFDVKGTALTSPQAFSQFFGLNPEVVRSNPPVFGDFISDPKCNYDVATNRWFMTLLQFDAPGQCLVGPFNSLVPCGRAHTLIAVSASGDPTGAWNAFAIDATDDGLNGTPNHSNSLIQCPCFGDQPLLGMNADSVFISTNEYGAATAANTDPANPEFGAQIYAISKSRLENPTAAAPPYAVHIDAGATPLPAGDCCAPFDSIQPATSPTAGSQSRNLEYFLSSFTNSTTANHAINTWVVTGTRSLSTNTPAIDLHRVQLRSETYVDDLPIANPGTGAIAVDQKTGPNPLGQALGLPLGQINANDDRMNQVVYADGRLWSGVDTALQSTSGGPARSGIAYFVVQPSFDDGALSAEMDHQGYVTVKGNSTLFPSIGVTPDGNGAIAFSVVGPDYFPSAAYVRITSDGSLSGNIVIAGAGVGPDDGFTQYPPETGIPSTVGRWGDYSAAVATPGGSIWMAAEYITPRPRTVLANWGTFVYHITADGEDQGGDG